MVGAMKIIIIFLIQIFGIQPAFSSANVDVNIGNTRIILPIPHNFSDPAGLSQDIQFAAEAMTPPSNRLLKIFISTNDFKKISYGANITLNRYFVAQTMRDLEFRNISVADFLTVRESIKSQKNLFDQSKGAIKNNFDSGSKKIGEKTQDPTFSIKVGEILPLGVFHEQNNSIGFSAIAKNLTIINGESKETLVVMSGIISLIKGKLIYLYAYSTFKSNTDTDWTQSASRQWLTSLSSIN